MNATLKAQQAYAVGAAPTKTPRGVEYDAVTRVTRQLSSAALRQDQDFPGLVLALNDNRRLWQIFASDVSSAGNRLPADLRARIFYLAEFTFEHTRKVLARKAGVRELIDVNTAILRGLNAGVR